MQGSHSDFYHRRRRADVYHGLLAVYIFNLFFAAIRKFGISPIVVL